MVRFPVLIGYRSVADPSAPGNRGINVAFSTPGFCSAEGGLDTGAGGVRVFAEPVITSKSKLVRCIGSSLVHRPKTVQLQRISIQDVENESRLGGAALGLATGARS
jgi:hypothetical protein